MWPLFYIPWVATLMGQKFGFFVSTALMFLHYRYRKPILEKLEDRGTAAIIEMYYKGDNQNGAKNDSEAKSGSEAESPEGESQVETNVETSEGKGDAKAAPTVKNHYRWDYSLW